MQLENAIDEFGKYLVKESRSNLTKQKHNDLGDLYRSLQYNYKVSKNSFEFNFLMEDYGKFQDQGVRGKTSSFRAPNSPFRFGTGTGKKGGLTEAMIKWVTRKRFQFRNDKGKFLSYEQTAIMIARSIYNKGIKPTKFYSRPFELGFKRLPQEITEKYALQQEAFLKHSLR